MGARSSTRSPRSRALPGAAIALAVALAGCGTGTTVATSAQPDPAASTASTRLVLHLDVGSYTMTGARTTIRGSATRGASVKVDGRAATMRSGRWHKTLTPHLGANRVVVEAIMSARRPAVRSITITRRRTQAEAEAQLTARRKVEARALAKHEAEAGALAKREAESAALVKREAEARAREQAAGEATSREAESTAACTNGTYVNAAGNTVCKPEHSPTVPAGATARCEDGTYSFSESRSGTCSHHGGVAEWLSG